MYVPFSLAGNFRGDLVKPPSKVWSHHADIPLMASAQADPWWEVTASQGCLCHSGASDPLQCSTFGNECSKFCLRDEAERRAEF